MTLTSDFGRITDIVDVVVHVAQRRCRGCSNKPTNKGCPDCPVRKHVADVELLGLIWDQHD